jgi:hypothetical protein
MIHSWVGLQHTDAIALRVEKRNVFSNTRNFHRLAGALCLQHPPLSSWVFNVIHSDNHRRVLRRSILLFREKASIYCAGDLRASALINLGCRDDDWIHLIYSLNFGCRDYARSRDLCFKQLGFMLNGVEERRCTCQTYSRKTESKCCTN